MSLRRCTATSAVGVKVVGDCWRPARQGAPASSNRLARSDCSASDWSRLMLAPISGSLTRGNRDRAARVVENEAGGQILEMLRGRGEHLGLGAHLLDLGRHLLGGGGDFLGRGA